MKRILLLYISEDSGHHCAAVAIENALHELDPAIKTLSINSFNYTNPILERIINKTYLGVVKRTPEIWDYLYDNPNVLRKTRALREAIHKFNSGKLKNLLEEFMPGAIVCTQAFPCGMVADYKRSLNYNMPLIGVLTDFAPHSYWIYDNVDRYVVPSEETARKLIDNGIDPGRIAVFGIPIDPKFRRHPPKEEMLKRFGLNANVPHILIMGGTQGLGPIKELTRLLDRSPLDLEIMVATGTNKRLYAALVRRAKDFRKNFKIMPYVKNIDELMEVSDIIVTKPGGITTAEALARALPMLIVSPLPGQEAMNTRYLLESGVAIKAQNPGDAVTLLEELLYNRNKLRRMSERARAHSKPDSSINIAKLILGLV